MSGIGSISCISLSKRKVKNFTFPEDWHAQPTRMMDVSVTVIMTHFLPKTPQVGQSLMTFRVIRNVSWMTANTTGEAGQCSTDTQHFPCPASTSPVREKKETFINGRTPPPEFGKTHAMLMKLSCVTRRGESKNVATYLAGTLNVSNSVCSVEHDLRLDRSVSGGHVQLFVHDLRALGQDR